MKEITTQATIKTMAKKENEKAIVQSVMAFVNQITCITSFKKDDIQKALKEAVNNVITFAYPDNKQGDISICISIYNNEILEIKVRDWGRGIENISKAISPLFTTEKNRSGMGFTFMEAFSDKLLVESTSGEGSIVVMEFKIL